MEVALEHHRHGDLDAARSIYRSVLESQPRHAGALMGLGMVAYQERNFERAISHLESARRSNPGEPAILNNLGLALAAAGREREALALWMDALSLQPRFADALVNLANADLRAGLADAAMARLREAIAANPRHIPALGNLGELLLRRRSYSEALCVLKEASRLDPRNADVVVNIGRIYSECGHAREARAVFESALRLRPADRVASSNLLMSLHYCDDIDAASVFRAHAAWGRQHPTKDRPAPRLLDISENGATMRIGLLSGDFSDHAVMRFLLPVLEHRDLDRAEFHCYYTGSRRDDVTMAVARASTAMHMVGELTDESLASRMRDDALDVLIDLSGHSADGRPSVLAHRPAPLQASWLGYLCSVGLPSVDFRLTDAVADPLQPDVRPALDRVWRLPSLWCYQPRPDSPVVSDLPSSAGGIVTFGSMNNPAKISESSLSLWAGVLAEVPGSRLSIYAHDDPLCRDRIRHALQDLGVASDRVAFFGRLAAADYLAHYSTMDIVLDTTPYTGGTTTCDALWMGVPVVTLAGDRSFSRTSASVLHAAGYPSWIAESRESYIRIARSLAEDIPGLAAVRAAMRAKVARSRLCETDSISGQLCDALQAMWQDAGLPRRPWR
jgi:predicted O-linked N-acetylglucosamine transferase (SPINDLY family)